MAISKTKEAILFYKNGQIKFSRYAVSSTQGWFYEDIMVPEKITDNPKEIVELHRLSFMRKGDVFEYAIFEEF